MGLALHLLSPVALSSLLNYGLLFLSLSLLSLFLFSFLVEKNFVALGCFQDNANDRAMGKLLKNLRQSIDWRDMSKTVKKCSEIARSQS